MRRVLLLATVLWASTGVLPSTTPAPDMLVIMLDGFRWDYHVIYAGDGLPGFDKFATSGVRAKYLNPAFPTNSFPNWHTIATGLYPESHGIVSNYMYDQERQSEFSLMQMETTSDPSWWSDAEPLWITTTKNHLDTALILWSRCDVAWRDELLPRYCKPYEFVLSETTSDFSSNVNRALDMIQNDGYKLVMLYEGVVDTIGHYYGPTSPELAFVVKGVDAVLQQLWQELEARGMMNTTNVVVLSDHGMTGTAPDQVETVDLGACLEMQRVLYMTELGSFVNIMVAPEDTQQVVEEVRTCPGVEDKVIVYSKKDIPERYHYRAHRLINQVLVIAKQGYAIKVSGARQLPRQATEYVGDHGYDNTEGQNPDMRGLLFAHGPTFASGVETDVVEQVDVYGLLCRALDISCHPNNGSMERVDAFFSSDQPEVTTPNRVIFLAVFTLIVAALILNSFGAGGRKST